jgi:hypothetical protein
MRAQDEEGHARPVPEGKGDSPDALLDDEAACRDGDWIRTRAAVLVPVEVCGLRTSDCPGAVRPTTANEKREADCEEEANPTPRRNRVSLVPVPKLSPTPVRLALAVPEPETIALDLTCAECGRSPRPGETWRILFADKVAQASSSARSAPSGSSAIASTEPEEMATGAALKVAPVASGRA